MLMTVLAILVALAVLYWFGSLAYAYSTSPIERARLNKQPVHMLVALLAIVSLLMLLLGICVPGLGNLSIILGQHQFRIWTIGLVGCIVFTAISFIIRRR